MKKLLVIFSSVLLIAGLLISCNSEVVNSEELAYVTFEDTSRGVQSSTTAGSVPDVNDLYWFYKATKASGSIHTGQTSEWTRVNPNGKGLAGTIGPFSVGSWYFELAGSASETAPEGITFDTSKSTHEGWTVGSSEADTAVNYVGFSVAANANTTRSAVTINGAQANPTYIPISLTRKNNATDVTLDLSGVVLVDSTGVTSGNQVWYKVKRLVGDTATYLTQSAVSVEATSSGAVLPNNTTLSFEVSANGESTTITIEVYDDIENSASETVAQSASIIFNAYKGSTVTLSGSLDALAYACFVDGNHDYAAYVVNSYTGLVTFYETLQNAVSTAASGDTIKLLKNFSVDSQITIPVGKTITIDFNGNTINSTAAVSDEDSVIKNNGTLTLTDSLTGGINAYGHILFNYGTAVINNGNYITAHHGTAKPTPIKNFEGGNLTINDGSFEGVLCLRNFGTATINGGNFKGFGCSVPTHGHDDDFAYCIINAGDSLTITGGDFYGVHGVAGFVDGTGSISGGTFTTMQCEGASDWESTHYPLYVAGEYGEVACSISGGTFIQKGTKIVVDVGNSATGDGGECEHARCEITGGTFIIDNENSTANIFSIDAHVGDLSVTGGSYSKQPNAVTDGYTATQSGSTWTVSANN